MTIEYISLGDRIAVRLEGRRVGTIVRAGAGAGAGFYYIPNGSKLAGDTFATVAEVKRSLEGGVQ